jgi:O-antigen/teichoic acid export membrane protein
VGRARSISAWSTGSQVLRVLLAAACLAAGLGAVTVLLTVLVAIAAVAAGATWQSRGLHLPRHVPAMSRHSTVLILLTLSFAWLTNIEVVLVRALSPEVVSGAFAAAAVLAKMLLLVPTTLSLYLLPRFVHREADAGAIRYGVNVVLATVLVAGVVLAAGVWLVGDPVVRLLFGTGYALAADLLPWMAVAYLPWALAQGLLIRLTASASGEALVVLVAGRGAAVGRRGDPAA